MSINDNAAWKTLLPHGNGVGLAPQVGRVCVPPRCVRQRLTLSGGRTLRAVRAFWREDNVSRFVTLVPGNGRTLKMLDALRGGETIEFVGRSREWHDMDGVTCWTVVVSDMAVIPSASSRA